MSTEQSCAARQLALDRTKHLLNPGGRLLFANEPLLVIWLDPDQTDASSPSPSPSPSSSAAPSLAAFSPVSLTPPPSFVANFVFVQEARGVVSQRLETIAATLAKWQAPAAATRALLDRDAEIGGALYTLHRTEDEAAAWYGLALPPPSTYLDEYGDVPACAQRGNRIKVLQVHDAADRESGLVIVCPLEHRGLVHRVQRLIREEGRDRRGGGGGGGGGAEALARAAQRGLPYAAGYDCPRDWRGVNLVIAEYVLDCWREAGWWTTEDVMRDADRAAISDIPLLNDMIEAARDNLDRLGEIKRLLPSLGRLFDTDPHSTTLERRNVAEIAANMEHDLDVLVSRGARIASRLQTEKSNSLAAAISRIAA